MITKKEMMIRVCELEARIDSLSGSVKRLQAKVNKLEKCDKTPEISMKNVMTPVLEEKIGKYTKATIGVEEPFLTEKPKNVKTGKKKSTKKVK